MNENKRHLIENLMADYSAAIDSKDLERWPELFTEDGRYRVTNSEDYNQGYQHGAIWANSRGMLRDRISALREANVYEEQRYRHVSDAARLITEDEQNGTITVSSNFIVVRTMHTGDTQLFASGMYIDRIKFQDDSALFAERIVVCDSQKIDTLLAIPL
ncbi:anthranilate 1,2-dioxygenase small subunit [Marinobacterium zhoushanense]|uniref:Anthranilate 1,2-dioxygenase small subunit n=1 Tax=Marinobacterium zhoushanense TaxID=1679163 RepID=A0ABQ1K855_9GAMM|nr:aromatic-ring-hydroxylating dioxygenase subunit beta [Marinobacterium zhoushanense]GGB87494.1 anthranilate 1,2-dioxygenase small subunit [Marinobacterium zhoushanense]